jgi:hypothetical protein
MDNPTNPIAAETHELYLHLLHLQQPNGEAATDSLLLHREIANAPEGRAAHVDATALDAFCAGTPAVGPEHLTAIRTVLDRAQLHAVNPKFWRPRWLKTRQSAAFMHPKISNHELHHHPLN